MTGIMNKVAGELETLCADWSERTGIAVEVWALPERPFARAVLTVVREALSNVERHSAATTASLAVTVTATGTRLTVSDNGRGFTRDAAGGGVLRMRGAVVPLGGRVSVHGVPGEGTTVTAAIPA